ncbi:MAG: 3-isopropylmalate dehydratase small subunit [Spirochaetales bacterium]|nr:3-isopropylmalate dehydratase small subunit [Spirochaetales bacterium]
MAKGKTIVKAIKGRAIPLPGDEIDTDRIIPARFLKAITFEGIGRYAFFDERFDEGGGEKPHPLNDARYRGGSILFVNKNFGCGSSREHAPQALLDWGVRALAGESFAEIFAGNCTALGMPAVRLSREAIATLMEAAGARPETEFAIDLETMTIRFPNGELPFELPESSRQAFLLGTWDSTEGLLSHVEEIRARARALPYLNGFR